MPNIRIEPTRSQLSLFLRRVQGSPPGGNQVKTSTNKHRTQQVEGAEMGRTLPTKEHFKQVPAIVGKPIHIRVLGLKPTGQEIECQREPIHLCE